MATVKKTPNTQRIYQLHIALVDIEPMVWRRLWVPGSLKLSELDRVLQEAFGWTNSHLHEFTIQEVRYGITGLSDFDDEEDLKDDKKFTVSRVLGASVKEFIYAYDFGDNWRHRVVVEGIMDAIPFNNWPLCLTGENACPPEDVGGTHGFQEFLESMLDTEHEEHFDNWSWHGGPLDPKGFDVNSANTRIRKLR
jgi:Plasmid pRiA4b ORF-3-like protein